MTLFTSMKICIAQTNAITGDIPANIEIHRQLISKAIEKQADVIIFPELSLTGYEPSLAKKLATTPDDTRLAIFQTISNSNKIVIGVGLPTKTEKGICITMVIFQPGKERITYSKKYLHSDEDEFFVSGKNFPSLIINEVNISLAICYEISVPQHTADAFKNGPGIYLASVAKSLNGIDKALKTLAEIACKYKVPVLMSNCVGVADGMVCAGRSSILNDKGNVIAQLGDANEAIIVWDSETADFQVVPQ
jgi:predicted amidohydrolase